MGRGARTEGPWKRWVTANRCGSCVTLIVTEDFKNEQRERERPGDRSPGGLKRRGCYLLASVYSPSHSHVREPSAAPVPLQVPFPLAPLSLPVPRRSVQESCAV